MSLNALDVTPAPSYCDAITTILARLHGGDGCLRVEADAQQLRIASVDVLPRAFWDVLDDERHVRVSPAVWNADMSLRCIHVVFARWIVALDFNQATNWKYAAPANVGGSIRRALAAFACPPSAIVDGLHEVIALWFLRAPIDVSTDAGYATALELQARLAAAVDAHTSVLPATRPSDRAAHDPAGTIPIAGGVRNVGADAPLVTVELDPNSPTYALADIEKAIARFQSPQRRESTS